MILIDNFRQVAAQIETERGVSKDILVDAIEQALISAHKRQTKEELMLEAEVNPETGEAKLFQIKNVVETVEDPDQEITLKDARKFDASAAIDTQIRYEIKPKDFGRIAALTAKQVILQRIREAEKQTIFDEYIDKVGTILNGTIQRVENENYLINLGRVESILFERDQIPGENFHVKDKIKVYLADIEKTPKGPRIRISRTHPGFLKCLFELEIPEIQDGIIEIKSVSREPGKRAKLAVKTNNPAIGAVGTCVGHMGGRIQSIIKEIGQEKIDVLEWDADPQLFIANALKPAKISQVIITNEAAREAIVVVPNDQLSLAIGKNGINVRLSVKLTNWKLDILSEDEFARKEPELASRAPQLSLVEKLRLAQKEEGKAEEAEPENIRLSKLAAQIEASSREEEEDDQLTVEDLSVFLGVSVEDIIAKAAKEGINIQDGASILDDDQVAIIKERFKN